MAPGELTPIGELCELAADLARAATYLVAVADEWVTAPAEARPALRARLHRWQTVLALGARCLSRGLAARYRERQGSQQNRYRSRADRSGASGRGG